MWEGTAAPAADAGGADQARARPAVGQARREGCGLVASREAAGVGRSLRTNTPVGVSDRVIDGLGRDRAGMRSRCPVGAVFMPHATLLRAGLNEHALCQHQDPPAPQTAQILHGWLLQCLRGHVQSQ